MDISGTKHTNTSSHKLTVNQSGILSDLDRIVPKKNEGLQGDVGRFGKANITKKLQMFAKGQGFNCSLDMALVL